MDATTNIEEKRELLFSLKSKFEENIKQYHSELYDEANTRLEFIDEFFKCLDWDVGNKQGFSQAYKEVVVEDKVKISGAMKAPDYSFRIGGVRHFFVEAKKPSVRVKTASEPAFQVRRYGYSAKLPLSILTNFEEFAVYDTRIKPEKTDDASVARIFYCTYQEYLNNFEFLYNTFSRTAILKGRLDTFVEENKNKRGTSEVDRELLKTLESWREDLAKNIALNNPKISLHELNIAVQKIVDRIIFLRIAEDKSMESYGTLLQICGHLHRYENKNNSQNTENDSTNASVSNSKDSATAKIGQKSSIYEALIQLFCKANTKYNSGLFATLPFLDELIIDDKVFTNIIEGLYYPDCPYQFSILPVEILGSIYEQFLGKTIRFRNVSSRRFDDSQNSRVSSLKTNTRHTAVIEEKPEVKKAGGVYYTPEYIVKYIVQRTVGASVEGKTPCEVAKLRIIDPSCGSGSFLVGAYSYLLAWHLDYYTNEKHLKKALKEGAVYEAMGGAYKLSIEKKQEILLNSIYGVDIDEQAVEVSKLSLYLKLLEDEGKEAASKDELFKHTDLKLLPSLMGNIKCGNSLISNDYYLNKELFDLEDLRSVNAFDFEKEFPFIKEGQLFDCVIGNPPYFNIQTLGAKSEIATYIQNKYSEIWQDKSDILFYFFAKAMELSKNRIGFIVSNAFLFSDKAKALRKKIFKDGRLAKIVNFEEYPIFKGVGITTCITFFEKDKKDFKAISVKGKNYTVEELIEYITDENNAYDVELKEGKVFALVNSEIAKLNDKIDGKHKKLGELFKIGKGMETATNKVFSFSEYPSQFPDEFIKKIITGKNIDRYIIQPNHTYILYFEQVNSFKDLPSSIQEHLKANKKILENRATVKNEGRIWWKYSRPMHKEFYHLNKIWCSYRAKENMFCLDESSDYIGLTNTTVIFDTNPNLSLKYLLTLLNSKILNFRYKSIGKQTGGGIYEYFPNAVEKLPIPEASPSQQEKLARLANQMMSLKKSIIEAKLESDKKLLLERASMLDNKIDELVFSLYGLNEKEIEIIRSNC